MIPLYEFKMTVARSNEQLSVKVVEAVKLLCALRRED